MSTTAIPSMIIEDIEPRANEGFMRLADPFTCSHRWEPHLWDNGRAHCPICGSFARWVNDPRVQESST